MALSSSSIDPQEINHFEKTVDDWWAPKGPQSMLHKINPLRIQYIKDHILKHFNIADSFNSKPLENLTILDAGCAGGVLSEPLARLGGKVTGIDASEKAIGCAKRHAEENGLEIDYLQISIEELSETHPPFDVITSMEVLEHCKDPLSFLKSCRKLLKPSGIILLSTLNRTKKSYVEAIIIAEKLTGLIPSGTHSWEKFIKPSELLEMCDNSKLKLEEIKGFGLNILSQKWEFKSHPSVNYLAKAVPI